MSKISLMPGRCQPSVVTYLFVTLPRDYQLSLIMFPITFHYNINTIPKTLIVKMKTIWG